ncbi:hypothetical protein GCM10009647_084600 [Streptomyces sanglieri]
MISPHVGYWLHTMLLATLFAAGTLLFARAWAAGRDVTYTRAYTLAGTLTVVAVLGSNIVQPGNHTIAPLAAATLTTIGWIQAYTKQTARVPIVWRWADRQ